MTLANGTEEATPVDFAPEYLWSDLLASISAGTVIPVIGDRLVTTDPNDELLHPQLARSIAERLKTRAAYELRSPETFIRSLDALREKWNAPGGVPSLNEVATAWVLEGGTRYIVYQQIKDLIVKQNFKPGAALRQLAGIDSFKLFVTTTFDPLLEYAIKEKRGGGSSSNNSTWVFEKDVESDLSARKDNLPSPTICYLLGRYDSIEFVVSEEDALEFVCDLGRGLGKSTKLALDLKDNGLLLIGVNFPDWLVRFFLRITKQGRLSEQKRFDEYLAVNGPIEPSMTLFLRGTRVRFFTGEPIQFVAELARRYGNEFSRPSLPEPSRVITLSGESEPRIFISYAREDYDAAKNFYDSLQKFDLVCWLDKDRLKGGEKWPRELKTQVSEKCWVFISLISETTVKESTWEGWFIAERKMAMERTIGVADHEEFYFPVVIHEIQGPFRNEPDGAENYQWTSAPSGVPPEEFSKRLSEIIGRRKKPPGNK